MRCSFLYWIAVSHKTESGVVNGQIDAFQEPVQRVVDPKRRLRKVADQSELQSRIAVVDMRWWQLARAIKIEKLSASSAPGSSRQPAGLAQASCHFS